MLSLRTQLTALFSFTLIILLASSAWTQNLNEVKARMLNRKPAIEAFKNQGVIGEGNDGYLHMRQTKTNAQKVVNSENADRRAVYEAIAKSQGASAAAVGRRRAIQIAQIAPPGQWLQKANGTWYKK